MEHGENLSKESISKSNWKSLFWATLAMGAASVVCLIAAIWMLLYVSYGDEMWHILFKLKVGIIP